MWHAVNLIWSDDVHDCHTGKVRQTERWSEAEPCSWTLNPLSVLNYLSLFHPSSVYLFITTICLFHVVINNLCGRGECIFTSFLLWMFPRYLLHSASILPASSVSSSPLLYLPLIWALLLLPSPSLGPCLQGHSQGRPAPSIPCVIGWQVLKGRFPRWAHGLTPAPC